MIKKFQNFVDFLQPAFSAAFKASTVAARTPKEREVAQMTVLPTPIVIMPLKTISTKFNKIL